MSARRKGPKTNSTRFFRFLTALAALALAALFFLGAPFFYISDIGVFGNEKFSAEEIKHIAGAAGGSVNLFSFRTDKARGALLEDPYIKSADFKKTFPNRLEITIAERAEKCYVECKNPTVFLAIDETGMVLGKEDYISAKLPLIVGLSLDGFFIGEPLKTENDGDFNDVVLLNRVFEKYGISNILKIDLSDRENLHIFIGFVDVIFGSMDNYDYKVKMLREIMAKLPEDSAGFLDISDPERDAVFKRLK